ncbi:patatin-like phospholipase family protein [Lunatibacter salilacus]|uniref:patatin-like phospholipase family protein n=1 Tax=Lunatibacter salilacus TaxID=2483804 RepID=UPI00131A9AE5|nr:patatin-like phospholipase family protein [Lunatibacter salilacus]
MLTNPTLRPFESIGLCFSGGGYRASAFSLGVLSYLQQKHFADSILLEKVTAMSTVSGGTITGGYYASCQAKGILFSEFFDNLYTFHYKDELLKTALCYMEEDELWKSNSKKRSLINAFAIAYDTLLQPANMGELDELAGSHLKYVCFNATDFSFGLAFRFQNLGLFGNYRLYCEEIDPFRGGIRIADAIAASSCFPMGFEPIIFPDDFRNGQPVAAYQNLKEKPNFLNGVGIMDGGIVDNQGIGSMVNINNSNDPGTPLDLIMVNDVGSYMMPPWQEDQTDLAKHGKKSLESVFSNFLKALSFNRYYLITLLSGLLLILVNSMDLFFGKPWPGIYIIGGVLAGMGVVLSGFGIFTSLSARFLNYSLQNVFRNNIPSVLLSNIQGMDTLSVSLIRRMLTERLSSTFTMVNYIFLHQLRRINYNFLYENPKNKNRLITNTVYELNGEHQNLIKSVINTGIYGKHCERIKESALIASQMPTTLWWDDKDRKLNRLDNLVACGQFTTCYNLMKYIDELPEEVQYNKDIQDLLRQLKSDWEKFKQNPRFMVDEIKPR